MVKTSATSQTKLASSAKPVGKQTSNSEASSGADPARSAFTSAAIGMSWQLAIIVLLPIVGGYKLDQTADSSPLWTLIGLVVALAGSIFVIRKALSSVNNFSAAAPGMTDSDEVKHD